MSKSDPPSGIDWAGAAAAGASGADSALGADNTQTFSSCMNDENSARQELIKVWASYSTPLQARCQAEASAGGLPSYVDLLVCLQVAGDSATSTPPAPATKLKGASKHHARNTTRPSP